MLAWSTTKLHSPTNLRSFRRERLTLLKYARTNSSTAKEVFDRKKETSSFPSTGFESSGIFKERSGVVFWTPPRSACAKAPPAGPQVWPPMKTRSTLDSSSPSKSSPPPSPVPPRSTSTSDSLGNSITKTGSPVKSHADRSAASAPGFPNIPLPPFRCFGRSTAFAKKLLLTMDGAKSEVQLKNARSSCRVPLPDASIGATSHTRVSSSNSFSKYTNDASMAKRETTRGGDGPIKLRLIFRSKPRPLGSQSNWVLAVSVVFVSVVFFVPVCVSVVALSLGGTRAPRVLLVFFIFAKFRFASASAFFASLARSSAIAGFAIRKSATKVSCSAILNRMRASKPPCRSSTPALSSSQASAARRPAKAGLTFSFLFLACLSLFLLPSSASASPSSPIAASPTSNPATCNTKSSSSHTSPVDTACRTVATDDWVAWKYARITGPLPVFSSRSKSCMYKHV
mmetsp:Transcript_6667/g.22496  ORF Transcript_6667/g.22496 Transcript_6667/m.22496 type:complete len:455 (+) Transcript_6667:997-2361(+)